MSTTAGATRKQDMPPPGGYKKIPYLRVPAKSYFTGFQMLGSYAVVTAAGLYVYYLTAKKVQREEIEMRSAKTVIFPLLVAERDREFLKQLRRNRDEEAKLMANVPGWEVGTWYGEPVYKTLPKDTLVTPMFKEFYAHADYKSYAKRAHLKLWS
ncbi:NADH dehydrogenase [ubiquinone] 1 alpha subcomplex subunit 13 [Anastrepha obliqua]|uniref:NADH dehydrogenase [ubiquinone] 1 alpha subcomplex subunit 13 n=1 Tax=Anastrepha ludens TaxID=28586 RepID=UPI0023B0BEB4|nr:NADH dehydrogenase [ubiquinone] 1 alpha subcomplex subunit 13 [Anastrepha ludens]XP_053952250.1 NADH dehydrogenase [ubiquinone] 1 alpha subcomplex subunit 13 [Anastrepha ludens]XP_053952251.1 NADH dehydrogenase [ubiquinone] 1 alpha subcomplex subunit 13 [Anastrepha ludens]XP_054729536.1 NADH dehydrogenase [ubiquinone] 1 alpha subcomplex subunit 13 [Anastrepha obliqua]XP_054729537.1 NADH dehydrogenase [ubiquinone] 1 alpha subcomplex subunit 13 [Anastrepha obliqua]XP_054729538.1 NADH dehydrog